MQVVLDIILIKISYVNRSTFVYGAELNQIHAASNAHKPGLICDERADAYGLAGQGFADGAKLAAILIAPGKKRNKVIERKDAQLVEGQRLFLSDSLDITNVGM